MTNEKKTHFFYINQKNNHTSTLMLTNLVLNFVFVEFLLNSFLSLHSKKRRGGFLLVFDINE